MTTFAFASDRMVPALKGLWKLCFGDPDGYIDLYFQNRYQAANTLVALSGNMPAAMLTMLPLVIASPAAEARARYVFAVATHPDHRGQGLSTELLEAAHDWMRNAGVALSLLVPASEGLFRFYGQRGYETAFDLCHARLTEDELNREDSGRFEVFLGRLSELEHMRNRFYANSRLFARWDREALSYIDRELSFFEGSVLILKRGSRIAGYAACYPMGPDLLVKELAVEAEDFMPAAAALQKHYGVKRICIRLKSDYPAGCKNMVLPFGMVKWYDNIQKEAFSGQAGEAPYLSHVLD